MSRGVLTEREYDYQEPGLLIDNQAWQEEIKKRAEAKITEVPEGDLPRETLSALSESDVVEEAIEIKPPEPTAEEILFKAKKEADEIAKSIEQGAKKTAFELVEQARWEANDILSKGKEEAEKEIQQMKEAAQSEGRKEGFELGREEGKKAGIVEGRDSFKESVIRWNHFLEELIKERKSVYSDLKPFVIDLTGEALRRCLKDEAEKHGPLVLDFVQEVLKKAQDRVHLRLHLNPGDVQEVELQGEKLGLSIGAKGIELVPDERVDLGGCRLETEAGPIEADVSTVVEKVKGTLDSDLRW